jgi:hypothetical protein
MKKLLLIGGGVIGGALLARRFAGHRTHFDFERMPETAPPKWMFRNISAIRENTDRILQLLESERAPAGAERAHTAA